MMKSFSLVKDDTMRRLTEDTANLGSECHSGNTINNSGLSAEIMRKLYPQKQAVSGDELKVLIGFITKDLSGHV